MLPNFAYGKDAKGNVILRDGRGGEGLVEAPSISLVDSLGADDGTLQLETAKLNKLGAQSLLIGVRRTTTAAGDQLTVSANRVELRNSTAATLLGPEIILAAKQQVIAKSGSSIMSQGILDSSSGVLQVNGDGALLRVAQARNPNWPHHCRSLGAFGGNAKGGEPRQGSRAPAALSRMPRPTAGFVVARIDAHAIALSSSKVRIGDPPRGHQCGRPEPDIHAAIGPQ